MRWLFELYQRFYDNVTFQQMAARIESHETDFIEKEGEDEEKLQLHLDQYLNFFEFVGVLHKKGQLNPDEIKDMFDFPLEKIAKDSKALSYVQTTGYSYQQVNAL
ncbi:hypothetical protein MYX77_13580, partial [Acidobacteriia bacterium AH_259_A11_L15]|nr:hypothetical protein [Acidobacteriia bacterium AH_259_A11_L15]